MLQAGVQNRGLVSDVTIGLKLEIKMFAEIASGHFQSITPILRVKKLGELILSGAEMK